MKKEPAIIKETVNAKHTFNDDELKEFGQRLAGKLQEQASIGNEFSAIKKQWASKLEAVGNDITNFAQKISAGFDFRPTECTVTFDTGKRRKYYFRCSDGSPAHDEEMTGSDFTMNLPLETETTSTPPEPGKIVSVGDAFDKANDSDVPAEPPAEAEEQTPSKKKGVKSRKPKQPEPELPVSESSDNVFE